MADAVDSELQRAAESLNAEHGEATGLQVSFETRWRGPLRVQGLCVWDHATDVFEPVRQRLPWTVSWRTRQSASEAAAKVEWFFGNRPDLPPGQRPPGAV